MAIKITSLDTHADGTLVVPNKLGIGTSNPVIKLEINQQTPIGTVTLRTTPQVLLKGFAGGATYHSGIAFSMNEHTSGYWGSGILSHDDTGSYGSALTFYTSTGLASASPTEKMRITSFGNVGIGTSSPNTKLHVQDTTSTFQTGSFTSGTYNTPSNSTVFIGGGSVGGVLGSWNSGCIGMIEYGGTSGIFGTVYNSRIKLMPDYTSLSYNNSTDMLYVGLSGTYASRVGIGTSSPSQTLDVNGTIKSASGFVWGTQGAIIDEYAAGNQIRMYTNTAGKGGWFQFPAGLSVNNPLSVYVSAGATSLSLTDSVNNSLYVKHTSGPVTFGTDAGGQMAFATNGFSERMRITASGNVGIGTSSPQRALHVVGQIAFGESGTNGARLFSSANDNLAIFPYSNTPNPNWTLYVAGNGAGSYDNTYESLGLAGNHLQFRSRQNANIYCTIYGYSTSYSQTLRFFRDANVQNWDISCADSGSAYRMYIRDSDSNDGVYIAQNSTSWTANSDSRLKDVQGTITDALAKVGQLTGVKFTWKRDANNPDAKVRVGLIAQDVQAVLPEAVDDESPDLITDEETGKVSGGLGVRYTEVVPLLVNAIKELTARVVTLEQALA